MIKYQHGMELFPTSLRTIGVSYCGMLASIINVLLPYVILVDNEDNWIPMAIIGLILIPVAVLTSFLPETLNCDLPQTITEANSFGSKQKYWSLAKRTTKTSEK